MDGSRIGAGMEAREPRGNADTGVKYAVLLSDEDNSVELHVKISSFGKSMEVKRVGPSFSLPRTHGYKTQHNPPPRLCHGG